MEAQPFVGKSEPSEQPKCQSGGLCAFSVRSSMKTTLRSQMLPAGYTLTAMGQKYFDRGEVDREEVRRVPSSMISLRHQVMGTDLTS